MLLISYCVCASSASCCQLLLKLVLYWHLVRNDCNSASAAEKQSTDSSLNWVYSCQHHNHLLYEWMIKQVWHSGVTEKKDILWTGRSELAHGLHRPDVAACTVSVRLYMSTGSPPPSTGAETKTQETHQGLFALLNIIACTVCQSLLVMCHCSGSISSSVYMVL